MTNEAIESAIIQFTSCESVVLRFGTANDVGHDVVRQCFILLKSNMEVFYKAAWSWKDKVKMGELQSSSARIISVWQDSSLPSSSPAADSHCNVEDEGGEVAAEEGGWETEEDDCEAQLHAFAHYRFCTEEGILSADSDERFPVLYIWEMQVSEKCRGRGFGRMLMNMLDAIACAASMHYMVLTVFSSNKPAIAFYKHMGFDHTMDCPSRTQSDSPHFILSKRVSTSKSDNKSTA